MEVLLPLARLVELLLLLFKLDAVALLVLQLLLQYWTGASNAVGTALPAAQTLAASVVNASFPPTSIPEKENRARKQHTRKGCGERKQEKGTSTGYT